MKCSNCGKFIPGSYDRCPYCNTLVSDMPKVNVDFGEVQNDEKQLNGLQVFMKEPKNKKYIIMGICLIVFIFIIFFCLILSLFTGSKKDPKSYFNQVVTNIVDYVEDNFTLSNASKSGEYDLIMKINDKDYEFDGNYQIDINNKIINLTNKMEDTNTKSGGIVEEFKSFSFDIYLNGDKLYLDSSALFDTPIEFPIDDTTGILTTKNVNYNTFIDGIEDAVLAGIKETTVTTSQESINYVGTMTKLNKATIKFDNDNKKKFLSAFYQTLMDDTNFVNEYARVSGKTNEEINTYLDYKITSLDYEYYGESEYYTDLSIYYNNSDKICRIDLDMHEEDNNSQYLLDIGDTKYYFEKYVDGENVLSATLACITKENDTTITKDYFITYDTDGKVMDIELVLKEDIRGTVKKHEVENAKSIRDLTSEEILKFKNAVAHYLDNADWVDNLQEIFKNKCTKDLECTCEKETCSCNYNGNLITCDINDVQDTSVSTDESTTQE